MARAGPLHQECITYDADMRTTVDLPPSLHRRASALAAERSTSLSAVLADLVARGLAQSEEPLRIASNPRTGLPVISIVRRVTSDEVADLIDEDSA